MRNIEPLIRSRFATGCLSGCLSGLALVAPFTAAAQTDGWSLEPDARIELGVVSAQSATRDEQIVVDGDAFTARAQVGVDFEDKDTRFRVEADRIEAFRLGQGRSDSNRDRLTALFQQELDDDWDVEFRARYYDDLATAESSDTDEIQGSARVTFEPTRAHRVRVRGTWREREYDNGTGPQTKGDGPRVDAQYRRRLGRYHYITIAGRAESISSDDPLRGYSRQSIKASYTRPITPDIRVRPAVELLKTRFDGRLTDDAERRKDTLVAPEVELLWWPGKFRVEAEAKYIFTDSNDIARDREGYRFTLTVGYVF